MGNFIRSELLPGDDVTKAPPAAAPSGGGLFPPANRRRVEHHIIQMHEQVHSDQVQEGKSLYRTKGKANTDYFLRL